jgi:putative hydrolases of HD superfamily
LHDKIAPELDIEKILKYALSHDIVELHAGDTYVFDTAAVATKEQREYDASEQLKLEWPDFPELTDYADGYAKKLDPEARFVYAIDKLLPIIMIELDDAKKVWRDKEITLAMERSNKVTIHQSEIMSPYYDLLLTWLGERGNIPKN